MTSNLPRSSIDRAGAIAPSRSARAGTTLLGSLLELSLPRFLVVGSLGLGTDASLFSAMSSAGAPDALARIASVGLATFVTWQLNRRFTFSGSGRTTRAEALRYAAVAVCAQGFNVVFFLGLRTGLPALPALVALVLSSGTAAGFSFAGQCLVTFRSRPAGRAPELFAVRP